MLVPVIFSGGEKLSYGECMGRQVLLRDLLLQHLPRGRYYLRNSHKLDVSANQQTNKPNHLANILCLNNNFLIIPQSFRIFLAPKE